MRAQLRREHERLLADPAEARERGGRLGVDEVRDGRPVARLAHGLGEAMRTRLGDLVVHVVVLRPGHVVEGDRAVRQHRGDHGVLHGVPDVHAQDDDAARAGQEPLGDVQAAVGRERDFGEHVGARRRRRARTRARRRRRARLLLQAAASAVKSGVILTPPGRRRNERGAAGTSALRRSPHPCVSRFSVLWAARQRWQGCTSERAASCRAQAGASFSSGRAGHPRPRRCGRP